MKAYWVTALSTALLLSVTASAQTSSKQASWQQEVDYHINVKLDDVNHQIEGYERLVYTNKSPNNLDTIYFHIWPNAYKNTQTAFAKQHLGNGSLDFQYAPLQDRGEIRNLAFKIDGQEVRWEYDPEHIDICYLIPNSPISPGQQIVITTPFLVQIPHTFSRLGHIGQDYQMTQWFPKPAVYDVNGWHPMPYLDLGEFYYEYGKFDVSITLPKNYIVAATGVLKNKEEQDWLNAKAKEGQTTSQASLTSSEELKTVRYSQDSIHDFAWFASKRFVVTKGEVTLKSGKKVDTWVYAFNKAPQAVEYTNYAVKSYSDAVGEYPYSHASVVLGPLEAGGGMEYPMITIVAGLGKQVIVHEVGHNWFQGILGSNERDYPWMDEGINNFYETLFDIDSNWKDNWNSWDRTRPTIANLGNSYEQFKLGYQVMQSRGLDQPAGIHSAEYTNFNYGLMIYGKNTILFTYLRDYLGTEVFNNCMQTYFERWKFKHPLPGDIQAVFEEVSGKKLDWFFVDLITRNENIDYKIKSATNDSGTWNITIKQNAGATVAVPIDCYKDNKVVKTIWLNPGETTTTVKDDGYNRFAISLKPTFLDVNEQNNSIKANGIFRKTETLSFDFGVNAFLQDPRRTQTRALLTPAWNEYNHFMLGFTFLNATEPNRKVQYRVTPLYSFSEGNLNGYARLQFNDVKKKGVFQKIESGLTGARFQYDAYNTDTASIGDASQYTRVSLFAVLHFRKSSARSTVTNKIYENIHYIQSRNLVSESTDKATPTFLDLSFEHRDDRQINPWNYKIRIHENLDETSGKFRKLTGEFNYKFNYSPKKQYRNVSVRLFGGTFIVAPETANPYYALRLGGNDGRMDYLFTDVLFDRSSRTGMFAQQLINREGNFKTTANILTSFESIGAMNLDWSFSGPLRFFFDAGFMTDYQNILPPDSKPLQYTGGISLVLKRDILRVNFPLFYSQAIKDNVELNTDFYTQRITFTLNLNKLSPFSIADQVIK